jgi:RHS repeat-associated protein
VEILTNKDKVTEWETVFGSFTIAYDAEGRQLNAQSTGNATVTYAYDGLGERVTKAVAGGTTTTYVHDGFGNLAAEYTSGGMPPAPPCTTCYLSGDHLGSTRMITDQSGNPVARHDYLPFGVEIPAGYAGRSNAWGTTDNVSTKFTGQERDTETSSVGLDFFQARYHGSAQGRFLSPDPMGNFVATVADPQSWNMYSYARNNPLTLVDPTGLDYCDWGQGYLDYEASSGECAAGGGTWTFQDQVTSNLPNDSTLPGTDTGTGPTDPTGPGQNPGQPVAPQPGTCQPIQKGWGYGLTAGASIGGGVGSMHSLGATGAVGVGTFHSPGGTSSGAFVSAGGFTAASGSLGNYPANNTNTPNFGVGAFGGVGGGVFLTNAGNVASLSGPFTSVMLGLPPMLGGIGVEFDYSNGIGVLSLTAGKSIGLPAGLMVLQTNTLFTTSKLCK